MQARWDCHALLTNVMQSNDAIRKCSCNHVFVSGSVRQFCRYDSKDEFVASKVNFEFRWQHRGEERKSMTTMSPTPKDIVSCRNKDKRCREIQTLCWQSLDPSPARHVWTLNRYEVRVLTIANKILQDASFNRRDKSRDRSWSIRSIAMWSLSSLLDMIIVQGRNHKKPKPIFKQSLSIIVWFDAQTKIYVSSDFL